MSVVFENLEDKNKWIKILDDTYKLNLCLKIFKPSDNDSVYEREMEQVKELNSILDEDELIKYTTHRRVDGEFGYTFDVGKKPTVFLLNHNTKDEWKLSKISFMFLEKCQDLQNLPKVVDAKTIMDDIFPLMKKLHSNGYAHGDIKIENMVYCGDHFKLIDIGMLHEKNWLDGSYTFEICAPLLLRLFISESNKDKKKHFLRNYITSIYNNTNRNYLKIVNTYFGNDDSKNSLINVEKELNNSLNMDIYQYNDQYMLAYLLHDIGAIGRESFIIDLLTKPGYFKQSASSGGALKLTRKGTVDILGRTRALYVTTRGKQYIRHKNQWVAVAELRKKKH